MKQFFLLLLVSFLIGCIGTPTPVRPADPAYHFTPGEKFELSFAERLTQQPRDNAEKPTQRSTVARFTVTVIAVREDGAAHLLLEPTFGQVSLRSHDQPDVTYEIWTNHPREPDDYSIGARYLPAVMQNGLHVVVDNEGNWRRDYHGLRPPADFLDREQWSQPVEGLSVYPNPFSPKFPPAWLCTFMPTDWRKRTNWTWHTNLIPHPPMTGYIPLDLALHLSRREGSFIYLTGAGRQAGEPHVKPPLGIVVQGDVTTQLEFSRAAYDGRFDLDLGLPIEAHLELAWVSTRTVAGLGTVVSDDGQNLTFKLRKM